MAKKVSLQDEFNKNKELTKENFETFKDWYNEQERFPPIPDELLVLFLHSCFFDIESAKITVKNFLNVRTEVPEVFCNRDPYKNDLVNGKSVMQYFMLSQTTPENYRVLFIKFGITDPSCLNFAEAMKSLVMHTDMEHYINGSSPGWIILQDVGESRLGHVRALNIYLAKKQLYYLQEAIPIRLKGWHLLNVQPVARIIFEMMRPFIKKELYEMMHFHTNGLDSVYEYVPKHILPSDYGGDDQPSSELVENELKLLQYHEKILKEDIKLLPEETKKEGKKGFFSFFS